MTKERLELEDLAFRIIERMKHPKEMGSTHSEVMAEFQGASSKKAHIAYGLLRDVNVITDMPEYNEKAIRLTDYGWYFPGFEKHRKNEMAKAEKERILMESSISNNKRTPIIAAFAAGFALISLFVSILTYAKADEKLSPALNRLEATMKSQKLELELIPPCLEKIDSSIRKVGHNFPQ